MSDRLVLALFVLLNILGVADVIVTGIGLNMGISEQNPLALASFQIFGFLGSVLIKFSLLNVLGIMTLASLRHAKSHDPKNVHKARLLVLGVYTFACGLTLAVVYLNIQAILLKTMLG